MRRTGAVVAAFATLIMSACAPQTSSRATQDELEPATLAGLGAAVLSHLDPASVTSSGGTSNDSENWSAVSIDVTAAGASIPLTVMVHEIAEEADRPSLEQACATEGESLISCSHEQRDDGSFVVRWAAREDLTGGISRHGFTAYVAHSRADHVVLVMEEVATRTPHYVDLTQLPVDVSLLEEIATDPLVGTRTSPQFNAAGTKLEGF